jgi:hypothetical protein
MIRFRDVLGEKKTSAWYPLNDIEGESLADLRNHLIARLGEREIKLKPTEFDNDIWEDNYNRQYKGIIHATE